MTTDLYEAIAAEQTDEEVAHALSAGDELAMRLTLARIAALGQQRERLLEISASILERYTEKLRKIDEQVEQFRESARVFIQEHHGGEAVAFPDVGTGYLTTRNKGGKAKLSDADTLAEWLEQHEVEVPRKPAPVDAAAALDLILADHTVTANGLLVDGDGEVVTVPGVEVLPESKAFAFRKAA